MCTVISSIHTLSLRATYILKCLCNLTLGGLFVFMHTVYALYAPSFNPSSLIIIIVMRKSPKCVKGTVWSTHLSPLICSAT